MARIGIDVHAYGGRLTGNETYITNLVETLFGIDSGHEFVLLFTEAEAMDRWCGLYPETDALLATPSNPFVRIPFVLPWLIHRHKLDLLHVQYAGPPFPLAPLVTTIHDISFETHPEFFSPRERVQFKVTFPLTAHRAERVLTVSQYSKRDLVEIYGLPEEKVVVTPEAAGPEFSPMASKAVTSELLDRYGIERDYILAVGNLQPRKNMVRLISAYTRLREARPDIDHQLVIVGKKAWRYDPILEFMNRSRWSRDIIQTGYVPEEDLPGLYGKATLFAYPSLYEGFGLPPLEAMACGTPVIVSDRSSLPEVVGDAGVTVDPFDVEGIAAAIGSLILNPSIAAHFSRAGLERARMFSWDRCAEQTLAVYDEVLRQGAVS